MTEIGERGINLSGGQKSRVSFCRALLAASSSSSSLDPSSSSSSSNSRDIVILDDPFSSVDGQTGNQMFHRGVLEGLRGKTRLVALNSHLHLLPHFDRVAVLHEGVMQVLVPPTELFSAHSELYERVLGSLQQEQQEQTVAAGAGGSTDKAVVNEEEISGGGVLEEVTLTSLGGEGEEAAQQQQKQQKRVQEEGGEDREDEKDGEVALRSTEMVVTSSSLAQEEQRDGDSDIESNDNKELIATETKDTHSVSIYSYFAYFGAAFWTAETTPAGARALTARSVLACASVLLAFLLAQSARVYCDVVLLQWVDEHGAAGNSGYYRLYLACVAAFMVLTVLRSCLLSLYATAICKRIHNMLFRKILNAPVPDFFDVTKVGNILNRFAKDMETTDVTIPEFMNMFLFQFMTLLSVVGLCIWSLPPFTVLVLPVLVFVLNLFLHFAPFSRDIKRLESVSRTPVYSSFSETLTGACLLPACGLPAVCLCHTDFDK